MEKRTGQNVDNTREALLQKFDSVRNSLERLRDEDIFSGKEIVIKDPEATERISEEGATLEEEKQALIQAALEAIDSYVAGADIDLPEEGRAVQYDSDTKQMFLYGNKGKKMPMTLGEVLSGASWGAEYKFFGENKNDISIAYLLLRKIFQVKNIRDEQVALVESLNWYNQGWGTVGTKAEAYEAILKQAKDKVENAPVGVLAERITFSFLRRMSIDYPELDFEVVEVDPRVDVNFKIDFILKLDERTLSDEDILEDKTGKLGVQVTISTDEVTLKQKRVQVKSVKKHPALKEKMKLDDIILVTTPLKDADKLVLEWQKSKGKVPGGPDSLLPQEREEQIFRALFEKVYDQDKVDDMWETVLEKRLVFRREK